MALTKDSVLFYQDFGRGRLDPIVGGAPTFLRAGGGWKWNGRLFVPVIRNQPRFEPIELEDGDRQAGLLLEPATEQELAAPFDFSDPAWSLLGGLTRTDAASLFVGKTASKLTGDGATAGGRIKQAQGVFTTASETVVAILEKGNHASFEIAIFNDTASSTLTRYQVDWATLTPTLTVGTAAEQIHVEELRRFGPNGGKVARVHITDTNAGGADARAVVLYPVDTAATANHAFVHYIGWEENAYGSSPLSGPADTSQARDEHRYANGPPAGRVAWYHRLVLGSPGTGVQQIFGLLGDRTNWTADPRFLWFINVFNQLAILHDLGATASTLSVPPSVAFEPGQDVEIVAATSTLGNVRGLIRTNGGAVQDTGVDTTNPGIPSAWTGDGDFVVGTHVDQPGRHHHGRVFAVDPADMNNNPVAGSGAPAEDVMRELSEFYMTPAGEVV